MLKAVIIDDEPLARAIIKEYLKSHTQISIVQECSDGFEGVKAIAQHQPELIFLDIQMPKINGFEMLELLDYTPAVIFTTAFDEYALKAFEVNAVDYLLKPFSKGRFDKVITKWLGDYETPEYKTHLQALVENSGEPDRQMNRVVVKIGNNIRIIPITDIHYFEAADDYVKIYTHDSSFLKKKTMNYFENVLNPSQFVRVHRSYIVQVQQVTRIEPYEKDSHVVILRSGVRIPISKTGYPKLKSVLGL
ncbi:MAG TPA: LytTR family transcriptional regulator DNA-binding domain-containing protein [Gammaproteobacteria bacterium]|jgi:two-component system LytT family response regulator|nr:LytTR family transcriptional regulator DNA-binding domain-containing protein [Gammaproteobacteria bacterium]